MPQLDFVTYLNQYLWAIGVLTTIVTIMVSTILPPIKRSLECRTFSESSKKVIVNHSFASLKKLLTT
uniref:ATP synthase F0 subunit 8 n=1 Tax=Pelagia noctiluca TaxID=400838 RepID=G9ISX8_PELNO|nr:ATP synthase F0 subunit 8 [Pelagia noctiluca]